MKSSVRHPTSEEAQKLADFLADEYTTEQAGEASRNNIRDGVLQSHEFGQIVIFENWTGWHPGYVGKLAMVTYSEPQMVDVVTFDDADEEPTNVYGGELG